MKFRLLRQWFSNMVTISKAFFFLMLILGFIHKTDSVAKDNTKSYSFLASHPVDSEVGGSRPWAEENQYVEEL